MSLKVLILGINGFIGQRLTEHILSRTDWDIVGMDLFNHRLSHCLAYPNLEFKQGDVTQERVWISHQIQRCDVVLPLLRMSDARSTPEENDKNSKILFETNLDIIDQVNLYNKRLVLASCSQRLSENLSSQTNLGTNHEYIDRNSLDVIDQIVHSYGKIHGLQFTLFKPFNWIGPNQDEIFEPTTNHHNIVSRFIASIVHQRDIELNDQGNVKQSFIYIDDAVAALVEIIENKNQQAVGRIFNIANPNNLITLRELAEKIVTLAIDYPKYSEQAEQVRIICQDEGPATIEQIPSIEQAQKYLSWEPRTDIDVALHNILDSYLR